LELGKCGLVELIGLIFFSLCLFGQVGVVEMGGCHPLLDWIGTNKSIHIML